jgi:FG-GAP repeat protein
VDSSQQAYLKASNTGANDAFAAAAVSGDTVVVGAYHEGSNAAGQNPKIISDFLSPCSAFDEADANGP